MTLRRALGLVLCSGVLTVAGCGGRGHGPITVGDQQDVQFGDGTAARDTGHDTGLACIPTDAGAADAGSTGAYAQVEVAPSACPQCEEMRCAAIPSGCGPDEQAETECDGMDNDCDGRVDEGCACQPGETQSCFRGPPGRRNHGVCADGMQVCQGTGEFGTWSECTGGITPSMDTCDGADNNCDGCPDNAMCCHPDGTCPSPGDPRVPDGVPFQPYTLHATDFFSGIATSYSWQVDGGPCDQLLYATSQTVSFALMPPSGDPRTTASQDLTFLPTLSGDYTVTFTAFLSDGTTFVCTFLVKIRAPGFRAELCWDRTGETDLDLWVHRANLMTDWPAGSGNSDDTCYYGNCKNSHYLDWGYPPSSGGCNDSSGVCDNPRLDLDNVGTPGLPENINIDVPNPGETFRVAVNFFGGSGAVHPMVNVYCGGRLLGTYGGATVGGVTYGSAPVDGFDTSGGNSSGSLWRVVDVTADSATDCTLHPLVVQPAGTACVETNGDRSFNGANCVQR